MRLGAHIHVHAQLIFLTLRLIHRVDSFALGKVAIYLQSHDLQVLVWNVAVRTELVQQVGVFVGAGHANLELVTASSDVGDAQAVLARLSALPKLRLELAQDRLLRIQNFLQ